MAVTAGASTPDNIVGEVIEKLGTFANSLALLDVSKISIRQKR